MGIGRSGVHNHTPKFFCARTRCFGKGWLTPAGAQELLKGRLLVLQQGLRRRHQRRRAADIVKQFCEESRILPQNASSSAAERNNSGWIDLHLMLVVLLLPLSVQRS